MGLALDIPALKHELSQVIAPIASANGLPNACYVDEGYYALERDRVFNDGWACVASANDVANPGDYVPIDHLGLPLLVLRDRDGSVKVFHNVCSHRGMILVEEAGHTNGVLRCPYHSWCYSLSGELKMTPHVGGPGQNQHQDFDVSSHGLREVRSATWFGQVFVNVSGKAADFSDYIGKISQRWQEFADAKFHSGSHTSFKFDIATNWKLAVENYCESYHLPWVHPSLNTYSRLEDHYNIEEPGTFSGQGTLVYSPTLSENGTAFTRLPGLSAQWDKGAEYIALFPNVLLGVHNDHAFAIRLEPKGPNRTIEHVELYYYDESDLSEEKLALRQANETMWHTVFEEDIFVVQGMQRGRLSPGYEGGVFSPVMDNATHVFHCWNAETMLSATAET